MSAIKLYELCGSDPERRFSPFVWRIRMALKHKGLAFEGVPWRFTEKPVLEALGAAGRVPVIVDGAKTVHDSFPIAEYLEDTYPDRPSLFGGAIGRATTRFFNSWADAGVLAQLFPMLVRDIWQQLGPADQTYFRESREPRLGKTLEQTVADRDARLPAFRQFLTPVRLTLAKQPFLSGANPAYADYILFGCFMWARNVSPLQLLATDDPVHAWRERMLDLFDGEARNAKGYPV
jgi:glutathione S-transferase